MAKEFPVKWRFGVVDKLTGPMKRMTKSFAPITKAARRANIQFKLMQRNTAKLRKNIGRFGAGMKNVGKSMSLGLTAPIIAFGASTINTAINFEKSMNKISALTKATGKPLNDMRELAKKLGAETQFSASQAADAMAFLGQAGFSTNKILSATPAILDLAAASNTDLARSADIASNIMGAFGLEAKDMTRIADVLASTTAASNVDMEMLAESMKVAAPVAKQFGLSIEETSSAIGLLGNVGIQGSLAGSTLKNMMLNLTAPSSKAKKLITALGVDVVKTDGSMRSLTDILSDLGPALGKIPKAKQLAVLNEVFGKRAIAGAGELVTQALIIGEDGVNSIERFTKSLKNSSGAAKTMAATMQKGAPGAVKALSSSFEGLQIAIAESGVLDMFTGIVKSGTKLLRSLAKTNPEFLKMASVGALVVAVLGPMLLGMGFIVSMIPSMITGFSLMKIALLKFSMASTLAMLPLIAAIGLLAVSAFMVMKNWRPIKEFFSDFLDHPLEQIKDMIGFTKQLASSAASFFGFGDGKSDVDKQLEAQGFKISDGAKGAPLGADKITKKSNEAMTRQRKSQVDINFSNMPKGTDVISSDKDSQINVMTGLMGAF